MSIESSVKAVPMTSFNSADLTTAYQVVNASGLTTYQVVNASGLPEACFLLRISNNSDTDILVSYDGTTDHDFVKLGTYIIVEIRTNANPNNSVANIAKKTRVYVKGSGPGTGFIYLSAYYQ